MAKGYLISDIHIGLHRLSEDKWLEINDEYFYEFLIPTLREVWEEGDKIFILGDLFDNRTALTLKTIGKALDIFKRLEEENMDVVLFPGNHDLWNNNNYEFTSLRILERHPKVELIMETKLYDFSGKKILMMPWVDKIKEEQEILREYAGKADYVFCHSDLQGAKTNLKVKMMHGINVAEFVGFPKVYSGHIHLYQNIKNFTFLGSPFHMDRNDKFTKKGITVLDFDNGCDDFIENTISPKFITIKIEEDSDITKLDQVDDSKDFIDVEVKNSLIVNNKDIRKRLDSISRDKKIAKLNQIDDITVDNTIKDVELDDIGDKIKVDDMMRDFVSKQEYDDNVMSKSMKLLEEVIRICTNN